MSTDIENRPRLKIFDGQKAPLDFLSDAKSVASLDKDKFKFLLDMIIQNKIVPIPLTEETYKNMEEKTGLNPSQIHQIFRFCNQVINKLVASQIDPSVIASEASLVGISEEKVRTILESYEASKDELLKRRLAAELRIFPYPTDVRWRVSFGYKESAVPYLPIPKIAVNIVCSRGSGEDCDYEFEMTEEEFEYVLGKLQKAQSALIELGKMTKELRGRFSTGMSNYE